MDELRLGPTQASRAAIDQPAWQRGLQLGQVLRAQVISSSAQGEALLRIAGRQVAAATDNFLPRGAWLNLRVTGLAPIPTVRILEAPARTGVTASPLERQTLALLPQQGNVVSALQSLYSQGQSVNLLTLLGGRGGLADIPLDQLVLQGPPRSPEALQRALSQSGLFYESGLVQRGAQGMPIDLKALLLRLRARVERAQGERQLLGAGASAKMLLAGLGRDLEGALATISLNQLSAAHYAQQDAIYWVFHVPFTLRDQLHALTITLAQEQTADSGGDEEPREWKALLDLKLPHLGKLEAEVYLRATRVSVVIYTAHAATQALLEAALEDLRNTLAAGGFEVGVVRVHLGLRGAPAPALHTGLYSKA